MNIADWLQGLGLEQYVAAFRDNDIDWAILSSLTSDDLSEIGIRSVGHRRRILQAIAGLQPASSVPEVVAEPRSQRRSQSLSGAD